MTIIFLGSWTICIDRYIFVSFIVVLYTTVFEVNNLNNSHISLWIDVGLTAELGAEEDRVVTEIGKQNYSVRPEGDSTVSIMTGPLVR
jgi:hypothetical protein